MTQEPEDAARLILVTPPRAALETLTAALPDALASGLVATVRLDMPGAPEDEIRRAADALRVICHAADVALVIRDHFRMVRPLGLDGAQVDLKGASLKKIRAEMGEDAILGVACGTSRHDGMVAGEAGADYVLFGPFRAPEGLGAGETAPMELFEWWGEMIETPSIAEGGVTVEDAGALSAHADFIAPDVSVWDGDLVANLRRFQAALDD
ncbi:thiamine-phosphate pyrophosphorylase [Albimonas donghaensis]|uniref:Thiamine-phosphate pyrophosphorylase n=1 Tax=Albimonas donghaensis TaxID=356660 RepID=A0A1H3AP17_9RHOB|nr:thiamine phosphate synthase [Albimonas donghaensis]SDX31335.1 thiamine-phosphate pyrophosphorylase [Albimonas donghaensis]